MTHNHHSRCHSPFQHSNESNKLHKSNGEDEVRSSEVVSAVGEGVNGVAGIVDVAGEMESSMGGNLLTEG